MRSTDRLVKNVRSTDRLVKNVTRTNIPQNRAVSKNVKREEKRTGTKTEQSFRVFRYSP